MSRFVLAGFIAVASVAIGIAAQGPSSGGAQEPTPSPRANPTTATGVVRPKENPIPDTFVNLQVLPKNISKPELVGLMKQFSITFKVRCSYCHSVSDDLTQGSFDSDEKQPKLEARKFMRTLMTINKRTGG